MGTYLISINDAVAKSATSANNGDVSLLAEGDSEGTDADPSEPSNTADVKVDVIVSSVLSLAVYPVGDHSVEADQVTLNPIPGAGLATNMLDLVVRTNVATGYQLTIEDKDTSADLVNTTDANETIPTLSANTNTAGFPSNQWGYSVGAYDAGNSEFRGVPLLGNPDVIAQSDNLLPGDGETTTVSFGVKVDSSVANGTYEDIVVFTASPKLVPSTYTLTIHYRNEDGTEGAPDYVGTFAAGASYDVLSPEVAGYYPSQERVTGNIGNENVEKTVTYSKYHTATVKYVYEDNTEASPDAVQTGLKPGDPYSFTSPTINGYYPSRETVSGTIADQNVVETVTYSKYYSATVTFVDEAGATLSPTQTVSNLKTGESYNFNIPSIPGYYTDETSPITGTIGSSNFTKAVVYKKYYSATVTYVYENGTTASETQTKTNLKTGDPYSFTVPAITGYYADTAGPITGTIASSNFTKTVTYKPYRTMTITYKDTAGTTIKDSTTQTNLKTGDPYSVLAPAITGYTANQATYTGTVPANDFTVNMVYTKDVSDITGITKMQDMTTAICNATTTPTASATTVPEATLTDTRNSKAYKVRKLADGKCWMVQDLNYSLSTSKALTSADSDVSSSWTPNNNTQTSTGTTWETPSATTARSYTNGTRTYYNWYLCHGWHHQRIYHLWKCSWLGLPERLDSAY